MFHAMLADSSESSMIILSAICMESMVIILVTKHQVRFKWTWCVIYFDGTIGRLHGQVFDVIRYILSVMYGENSIYNTLISVF
jgi:hypothetical protein